MGTMRAVFSIGLALLTTAAIQAGGFMPGSTSRHQSKYDNAVELDMTPQWVTADMVAGMKLGLTWSSAWPQGLLRMTVMVQGAHSIEKGESLHFNVDGEFFHFGTKQVVTDIDTEGGVHAFGVQIMAPSNWSAKAYAVPEDFIRRVVAANSVVVRVDTTRGYAEKEVKDGTGRARQAFRNFLKKLDAERKKMEAEKQKKQKTEERDRGAKR